MTPSTTVAVNRQAADKFVSAIEGITSTKKRVLQRSGGRELLGPNKWGISDGISKNFHEILLEFP